MRPREAVRSLRLFLASLAPLACGALLVLVAPARAQTPLRVPTPNGIVHAIANIGNTAYVGGEFDKIGFYTGGGAAFDAGTGASRSGNAGFRVSGVSGAYPGGIVTAAVADGAGGWFVGGDFHTLGGVSRPYLARVDANGNLSSWTPPAPNASVWSLLLSGSTLYVGGDFTALGGTARARLAAVDAGTGALLTWNPGADARADALAISGTTLYVGGSFHNLGAQARAGIGAVDTGTGLVTGWNPNLGPVPPYVNTIAIAGAVAYIGGYFGTVQGIARTNAAAVDLVTGAPTAWAPNPNDIVYSLIVSGSSVYAGGDFSSIGGRARQGVALLNNTNGQASNSWNAAGDGSVHALALGGTTLYLAGWFTTIGGQPRGRVAAIDAASALANGWAPTLDAGVSDVWCVAPSGSGVWIGGSFQRPNSVTRRGLAAIDLVSRTVTGWDPNVNGTVHALATDGTTLYVGGNFAQAGGLARKSLAAYALPSSTPTALNAGLNAGNPGSGAIIHALALEPGVLRLGGYLSDIGGQPRSNAGAVDVATGLATPWAPQPNATVLAILPSAAGVYVAGSFTTVQGVARSFLAQVDRATGTPTSWVPPDFFGAYTIGGTPIPAHIHCLAERSGVLYVGGFFNLADEQPRESLAALDASGAVLPWHPPGTFFTDGTPGTVSIDATGSDVVAGGITFPNGFRAIDPVSGASAAWPPVIQGVNAVDRAGGYLLAGGGFLDAGAMPSPNLALFIDPAALDAPDAAVANVPLALSRPAPNPARLESSLTWTLAQRSVVSLTLHDLAGRRVRTIVDRAELPAGPHRRTLDVAGLAPGLYLLHAETAGARATRKLVIAH